MVARNSSKVPPRCLTLLPGDSRKFEICAKPKWNDTALAMKAGERYRFVATGEWCDASISTGPEGYVSDRWFFRLTERFRRRPSDNWFALIGAVGRDEPATFLIGSGTVETVAVDGILNCYANDLWLFYFNNSGAVTLEVTREH